MQPVAAAFKIARHLRPEFKSVGRVWNPTESNSEAQTKLARLVCAELGINLLEANAENATGVSEIWGLASVIIGEALVGSTSVGLLIAGAVMGSVLFLLLVAIAF